MHGLNEWTHALLGFYFHNELLALFLILLAEEAGIPMPPPGYTLLILSGVRHHGGFLPGLLVVVVSSVAVFAGSYATFALTRRYGRERLVRYAKFLRVKESRIEQMQRWMERHGVVGIAAGRLIPGLRVPTIFVAGLGGVSYRTFAIVDAITAVVWAAGYFWLGALFEPQWKAFLGLAIHALDRPIRLLVIAGLSVLAILAIRLWLKRQRGQAEQAAERRARQPIGTGSDVV